MENSPCLSLVQRQQFLHLKKCGHRIYPTQWMLFSFAANSNCGLRIGVTASRKVGKAVVRNKLKRWVREYFRTMNRSDKELHYDINVILRAQNKELFKGLPHEEFDRALHRAWVKFERKIGATA